MDTSDWQHQPSRREAGADVIILFVTGILVMVSSHPLITLAVASVIPVLMGIWNDSFEYFIMGYVIEVIALAIAAFLIILLVLSGGRRSI